MSKTTADKLAEKNKQKSKGQRSYMEEGKNKYKGMKFTFGGKEITEETAEEATKYIYDQFIAKGYSPAAASAAIGNILTETDNFSSVGSYSDADDIGMIQWAGSRAGEFDNYMTSKGKNFQSVEDNLEYLLREMETGNYWGKDKDEWGDESGYSNKVFKAMTDPTEAAKYFQQYYERPADIEASQDKRISYATGIHGKYANVDGKKDGTIPPVTTETNSSGESGGSGGGAGGSGTTTTGTTTTGTTTSTQERQPNYSFKYGEGYSDFLKQSKRAGQMIEAGKFIANASAYARNEATKPPMDILPERVGLNPYIEVNSDYSENNANTVRGISELRAGGLTSSYINGLHRNSLLANNQLQSATNNINNQGRISTNQGNTQIEVGNAAALMNAKQYNAAVNSQYAEKKGLAKTALMSSLFDNVTNAFNYDSEAYDKNLKKEQYDNMFEYKNIVHPRIPVDATGK